MPNTLFKPAPGFDQPIAVLKHCHDRIRRQIATMENLVGHLPKQGADIDAQQAAKSVLQYFNKAAHQHHEDEEHDLLPMLQTTAQGGDAASLASLLPVILQEHQRMDAAWQGLERQLQLIAAGGHEVFLSGEDVRVFSEMYAAHMQKEETQIAPMAMRLFSPAQMAQLGEAMRVRRGITQSI